MKNLFVAFLALSVSASSAFAKLPDSWKEIVRNPKYVQSPTAEQVHVQAIKATGGYEQFKVGDRFVFLFDPKGYPVVVFDLTLDPINLKDQLMGSIGIGRWSLRGLFKKYKASREKVGDLLGVEDETDSSMDNRIEDEMNLMEAGLTSASEDEIKRGYEDFAKIEFNDAWIIRNGYGSALSQGRRSGFRPASFTMGDLYLNNKQLAAVSPIMSQFSTLIYRMDAVREVGIQEFLSQFRMEWNEQEQQFSMIWSPSVMARASAMAKGPKIPGWVVNYVNPLDLLAYKYSLQNLERQLAYAEAILGKYTQPLGILLSRVTNGMKSRLDSHENQLGALLEAYARGEYKIKMPLEDPNGFFDATNTLLYLNKVTGDEDVTNGLKKRRNALASEAKSREDNLKRLAKKGFDVAPWSDGRFATISKKGKRKGVASLAIKRSWLTRKWSMHTYDSMPWYKSAHRIGLEVLVDAIRLTFPNSNQLSYWFWSKGLPIGFYMPAAIWDMLLKDRMYAEIGYEGHMIGFINEHLSGRYGEIPGYSGEELAKLRESLYDQRSNTFEVSLKNEPAAMKINQQLIDDLLSDGATLQLNYPAID